MRIHHLQHAPFEGLGSMEGYLKRQGHQLSTTRLYIEQDLPPIDSLDWLIVMGGPMGVHDELQHPWLVREKAFIKAAIESGKAVLGICLGAQLIADVLGAKVYKNTHVEIGWFPVKLADEIDRTVIGDVLPKTLDAFQWHGDTFDVPPGATWLGASEACRNQGFVLDDRVVAFQFHLEITYESAQSLIQNCRDELDGSRYVQTETQMLSDKSRFTRMNELLDSVLHKLENHHD